MTTPKEPTLEDFELFDPAVQQCPHAYYALMREEAPVYETNAAGTDVHLITRHEDVLNAVLDPDRFSNRFGQSGMPPNAALTKRLEEQRDRLGGYPRVATMLTADRPEHSRYRKLVAKAFTPRAITALEPFLRELAGDLIDEVVDTGTFEFVNACGVPLPVLAIAKALNVPEERLADFKRWSDASIAGIGTSLTDDERVETERVVIEFQHYFAAEIDDRRTAPRDDLLTRLVEARIDTTEDPDIPDEPLTDAEMISILRQLLVAGNETSTKMLTEMVRLLGEHPAEFEKLRADHGRSKAVVDETLRLATPTQGMWRITTDEIEVAGNTIPKGSRCVAMFASANRDPAVFSDPDVFNPDREGVHTHLAFGKGIHHCLGASLSRLEGQVFAEELAKRVDAIELDSSNTYPYLPSFMLRGLNELFVRFAGTEESS